MPRLRVQLRALFSPEHGIRGQWDERVDDSTDSRTGLPIAQFVWGTAQPSPDQLRDLDALVFDIQDIGCRFYTYISTMGLGLEAAAEQRLKFFVLDRVNPINGIDLEGPLHSGASSFTAFHSLPVRHGMTVGELAGMFNAERNLRADLTVIRLELGSASCRSIRRSNPRRSLSQHARSTEATPYPGVGLLESALSVGRGTDTPFEVVGAPYIDDVAFAEALIAQVHPSCGLCRSGSHPGPACSRTSPAAVFISS